MIKIGDVVVITEENVVHPLEKGIAYQVIEVHDLGLTVKTGVESFAFVEHGMYTKLDALYLPGAESDAVHHPSHYTQGKFEIIEVIEEITKGYDNGFISYCVGNTIKYVARAPFKHETPLEDLRKAATYLRFAIEHLEKEDAS